MRRLVNEPGAYIPYLWVSVSDLDWKAVYSVCLVWKGSQRVRCPKIIGHDLSIRQEIRYESDLSRPFERFYCNCY